MNPPRFVILSRRGFELWAPTLPTATISVNSGSYGPPPIAGSRIIVASIHVPIADVDPESWRANGAAESEITAALLNQGDPPMGDDHARALIGFYLAFRDRVQQIVVNCDAGISRSAGVVAALAAIERGEDTWEYARHRPNAHIKTMLLRAYAAAAATPKAAAS